MVDTNKTEKVKSIFYEYINIIMDEFKHIEQKDPMFTATLSKDNLIHVYNTAALLTNAHINFTG